MGRVKLIAFARVFFQDDSGQAFTEYILLLSAAVVLAGALARGMLNLLDTITLAFGTELEKNIKTGRADVQIWAN